MTLNLRPTHSITTTWRMLMLGGAALWQHLQITPQLRWLRGSASMSI
ncbi:MAG: hypothetical protein ACTSQF_00010 [Candidatus Heimdallarchaeaceae archaeon]